MSPLEVETGDDQAAHTAKYEANKLLALNDVPMVSFSNASTKMHSPRPRPFVGTSFTKNRI